MGPALPSDPVPGILWEAQPGRKALARHVPPVCRAGIDHGKDQANPDTHSPEQQ